MIFKNHRVEKSTLWFFYAVLPIALKILNPLTRMMNPQAKIKTVSPELSSKIPATIELIGPPIEVLVRIVVKTRPSTSSFEVI